MGNHIGDLRRTETRLLKEHGGVLKAADVTELLKKATTAEDKAAVRDMFMHDAFESPKTRSAALGKVNVKEAQVSPMAGKPVGNTTVVRTFGPPEGYTSKFQALATARANGVEPLAVVKDAKGMWHAAQTKDKLTPNPKTYDQAFPLTTPVQDKTYTDLAAKANPTSDDLKQLAVMSLGIPAELIHVGGPPSFQKDKLNIDPNQTSANGRAHVHDSDCPCGKNGAALEISPGRLKQGSNFVTATLMHEAQHVADDDALVSAIQQYNARKPSKQHGSAPYDPKSTDSINNFKGWVHFNQSFNAAQKATLKGMAGHVEKQVEGSAYLGAFKTMIGTDKEAALDQLLGFASYEEEAIKRAGLAGNRHEKVPEKAGRPVPELKTWEAQDQGRIDWQVRAEMMKELKATYNSLPEDKQQDFKKVVAIVESKYPEGAKLWSELFPGETKPEVKPGEIPTGDMKKIYKADMWTK